MADLHADDPSRNSFRCAKINNCPNTRALKSTYDFLGSFLLQGEINHSALCALIANDERALGIIGNLPYYCVEEARCHVELSSRKILYFFCINSAALF